MYFFILYMFKNTYFRCSEINWVHQHCKLFNSYVISNKNYCRRALRAHHYTFYMDKKLTEVKRLKGKVDSRSLNLLLQRWHWTLIF